ncbi:hypothetical protein [Pyxidicoccus xibeiensis]|uniref:hypothetical protein n=1 Tax=Pyxidicoccus xibeiensis TaxID=2906759 RepID=UPI0020A73CB0|nr:hypothetical protein [Pyxidicoccus xibeiensis]MCP3136886.1 hypothetical protein [Pyxidicoccus xibeiensis]
MEAPTELEVPRALSITVASALAGYLARTQELGAVEGPEGSLSLHPALQPVLEALHHVLAGGDVEVRIVHPGHPDIVEELNRRAAQATQEANLLSEASGTYLIGTV